MYLNVRPASAFFLIVLGCIIVLIITFHQVPSAKSGELWAELWKALLNFLLIVAIGGMVSYILKSLERSRDEQKALHDFRADFLRQFLSSYHDAKNSRRTLTRAGLTTKRAPLASSLDQEQIATYEEQMEIINSSQLEFERFISEVRSFPRAFSRRPDLENHLRSMESYLRELIREYERVWKDLLADPPGVLFGDLKRLQDFTGRFKESEYRDVFIRSKDESLRLIREDMLTAYVPMELPKRVSA